MIRSERDIAAAFEEIADEVEDALAFTRPSVAVATSARSAGRRWAAGLGAAAALVTGLVVLHAQAGNKPAQPGGGNDERLPIRSQLFTLSRAKGVNLDRNPNIDIGALEQTYNASVDDVAYEVDIATDQHLQAGGYLYPNTDPSTAEQVDINGATGYLGCSGHSSDPAGCQQNRLTLAWEIGDTYWVQIGAQNTAADRSRILRLARALDFARMRPLHVPVSLSSAPYGLPLESINLGWKTGAVSKWSISLGYMNEPAGVGSSSSVNIIVSSLPIPTERPNGRALTVDGHRAYLQPNYRLWVDAGNGRAILVIRRGAKLDDLTKIVRSVHIAADPDAPNTWPTAKAALP